MTAIQVLRRPNCIEFCTDGAGYLASNAGGVLGQLASKIVIFPEISCALASRGPGYFLPFVHRRILGCFADFDALLRDFSDVALCTLNDLQEFHNDESVEDFEVIVGGWSESRARFETYSLVSHDLWVKHGFAPWTLMPLSEFYAVPWPDDDDIRAVGLYGEDGKIQVALSPEGMPLFMQAQRLRKIPREDTPCLAGGFIQKTAIGKGWAQTAIVFHWNDKMGEVVRPNLQEAEDIRLAITSASTVAGSERK
jgi:hypothetical protein